MSSDDRDEWTPWLVDTAYVMTLVLGFYFYGLGAVALLALARMSGHWMGTESVRRGIVE